MECIVCSEKEVLKLPRNDQVKFICKNGHIWYEDYLDKGGNHPRPSSYEIKLEDILFPSEKIIYEKFLGKIKNNMEFYKTANPLEKFKDLVSDCDITEQEIYLLLKKITDFQKKGVNEHNG